MRTDLPENVKRKILEIIRNEDLSDLTDIIDNLPITKSVSINEATNKLSNYYREGSLVLVLGAGVSMGFGVPDWNTLLQKLMIETMEREQKVSIVLSKLFTEVFAPSSLISGRYLQQYYENTQNIPFEEKVKKALYEEVNIRKNTELMQEIVNFCVSNRNGKIDSIISYNFDDILEQKLDNVQADISYIPVYKEGVNVKGKLPIYHVHGFLPKNNRLINKHSITFGESIYHKQYIDIYSWNNIIQINKFSDYNCLFIGSSLTDPNIRRLLDIASRQRGDNELNPHFIFKMRYKEEAVRNKLRVLLAENEVLLNEKNFAEMGFKETVRSLIHIIERFEESDTNSFGVKTIWINEWSQIPQILKTIRQIH